MRSKPFPLLLLLIWIVTNTHEAGACAMFTVTTGDRVLMGNNEDYIEPGFVWFVPATKKRYGRVNFGFSNKFVQGSMNDQGLCFDAAVVAEVPYTPDSNKKTPRNLIERAMNECATVEQVIECFRRYNASHLSRTQFMFADKTGASAVIAWMPEKGLSIVRKDGPYQLIANTRLEASAFRCERYVLAERILSEPGADPFESIRNALSDIHQCGPQAFTSYSNIFDLTRGEVIVYNLADFGESITYSLDEELAKGKHTYELAEIFNNGDRLSEIRDSEPRVYDTEVNVPKPTLSRYAGTYLVNGSATEIAVRPQGNGLMLSSEGNKDAHLYPEGETLFRIREGGQITFDIDDTGNVKGLILHRFGDHYATKKR